MLWGENMRSNTAGKRVLVTGGAGFIGSALCDRLLAANHDVVILDTFMSGKWENLDEARRSAGATELTVLEGDARQIEDHASAIGKVDVIVHLAALISGFDSLRLPDEYFDVNVCGLLRVIEFARAHEVPRIVFASSSTVYGNNPYPVLSEDAPPSPLTVYATTKLAGEHLLSLYGKLHGFSHCSLRLFNVYGPRQAVDHPYANVTCKFSHAAARGLAVRRYGDGHQSRDFVFVHDVVQAFMHVLGSSREHIYNIGTGEQHSINELLGFLEKITGQAIAVEQHAPWPNDIQQICADITKMREEFGFKPAVAALDGLAATVAYFTGTGETQALIGA